MDGNEYRRCTDRVAISFDFVRDVVLAQGKGGREGETGGGKGGGVGGGGGGEDAFDNMRQCTSTRGGGGGVVADDQGEDQVADDQGEDQVDDHFASVADDQGEDQPRSNDHVASFTSTPVAVKEMSVTVPVCFCHSVLLCASVCFCVLLSQCASVCFCIFCCVAVFSS